MTFAFCGNNLKVGSQTIFLKNSWFLKIQLHHTSSFLFSIMLDDDHLFYFHDLHVQFRGDIVKRNYMLVTLRGPRVKISLS